MQQRHKSARKKNTRKQLIGAAEVNDPSAFRDDRTTQGKKQQVMTVSRGVGGGSRHLPERDIRLLLMT